MKNNMRVHFMGICGSGATPIAIIAKKFGFDVSGCDLNSSSYYSDTLKENGIEVFEGHHINHMKDIDILAISPAVLEISPNHPEVVEAKRRGILMTWQEFLGQYIQNEKNVISIAGTHGKSTSTILMGLVLENAGFDPIVEAGATFKPWGGGYRVGNSQYFVCEADEFNNNFLNYNSSIAIINNVEMDHPEFFKDINDVKDSFKKFIKRLTNQKVLIVNEECKALSEILYEIKDWIIENKVKIIGYYHKNKMDYPFVAEYRVKVDRVTPDHVLYTVSNGNKEYNIKLGLIGMHNVQNSLGVFVAALELGVDINTIKHSFESFKGIGRRLDLIGEIKKIKVFDDYAHHPTAISSTLDSFRMSYPKNRIYAIFEPHQISRTKMFFCEYAEALKKADKVIITNLFYGREINKNIGTVDLARLANEIDINTAEYIEDQDKVCSRTVEEVKQGDIVVVFGAGKSYEISKKIITGLKEKI